MDKKNVLESLKRAREMSKKRNFTQTIDLVINLKDLNLKNPEEQVDVFTNIPHSRGKSIKVCALVGPELKDEAKANCELVIDTDSFVNYEGKKKELKALAAEYDYFVAQANIMGQIAKVFGRVLGPRGKMPNPKAGCVVPPKANLKPLLDKLHTTVRMLAKSTPVVQVSVGREDMKDEEIAENIISLFNTLVHHLPKETNNINSVLVKTTMGKPAKVIV